MKAREYASFILQTGLEFGITVYYIDNLYCFTKEEAERTLTDRQIPKEDWVEIRTCKVSVFNIFKIIENWNVKYFPSEQSAIQASREFLDIISIADEQVRIDEYGNWLAERSSWKIGI